MTRKITISARLLDTLRSGRERLSDEALDIIRGWVASQRTDSWAFVDKGGREDIYYTFFGWMLSQALGMEPDASKMKAYLRRFDKQSMSLVDRAAWLGCSMLQRLAGGGRIAVLKYFLSPRRTKELAAFRESVAGDMSPYNCFLWLLLAEGPCRRIKNAAGIVNSMEAYRVPSGGYSNVRGASSAIATNATTTNATTTNATAAALMVAGRLAGYGVGAESSYLCSLQQPSGGFVAVEGAPVPDLLSTATALFTLRQYGEEPEYPALDFIEGHWLPSGGFAATLLDTESDVEYTFYGLLALGAS